MKQLLIIFAAFIIFSSFDSNNDTQPNKDAITFTSGENLTYLLYSGFIKGGKASMSLRKVDVKGKDVYHAKIEARTIGWADKMYKVRDVYESYFDSVSGKPLVSIRDIHESSYKYYNKVTYYHNQDKVVSSKSGEKIVKSDIYDLVSAFYQARKKFFNNLEIGDTIVINTFFDDKVWPLTVRYKGNEDVKVKAGKYNAMKFSPVVEAGRVFDTEDDMTFWVSNDKNRIPLRIEFELFIGSLKCDLYEYSGLQHKLNEVD